MTLPSKIIMLFALALLVAKTTFAACPEWDANTLYAEGEKTSYNGHDYVAVREIPLNTPPKPADNGWFWVESAEGCDNSVKLEADAFEVTFPEHAHERTILDKEGLEVAFDAVEGLTYRGSTISSNKIEVTYSDKIDTGTTTIGTGYITLKSGYHGYDLQETTIYGDEITTSTVKTENVIVSGVNLTQYILKLEARIAALEATQE